VAELLLDSGVRVSGGGSGDEEASRRIRGDCDTQEGLVETANVWRQP